jgi:hypothetical protein
MTEGLHTARILLAQSDDGSDDAMAAVWRTVAHFSEPWLNQEK